VALIGLGVALIGDRDTLGGLALIGLGVALIGGGVAAIGNRDTLFGVAFIGLGVGAIAVGVALLRGELARWFGRLTAAPGATEAQGVGQADQDGDRRLRGHEQIPPPT
jgi:hypothetical protein